MNRRRFTSSLLAALGSAPLTRVLAAADVPPAMSAMSASPAAAWTPAERYPDPAIDVLDPAFEPIRLADASIERLYLGSRWGEGPVWCGDQRALIWSDTPNDRLLRWDEITGTTADYRKPANRPTGGARDRQGRLITCENASRSVTRTEHDGAIATVIYRFDGKRLNSPNDVVVHSDGAIWFTDPTFGITNPYDGRIARQEQPTHVYRVDPATGAARIVIEAIRNPNGICFSPDETQLYVSENGVNPRLIWRYDVVDAGRQLSNKRLFLDCGEGTVDGFRVDTAGNLWCGWGMGRPDLDGVRVFSAQGRLIGRIRLPERCANLTFGGPDRNRLFMAAGHALFSLYVNAQGVPGR